MKRHPFLTHNHLRVNGHSLALPGLGIGQCSSYRLVHLSDFHFYEFTDPAYYAEVSRQVAMLAPDMVVATGDFIHYGSQYVPIAGEFLRSLSAEDGVFAVLGNHDYADGAHGKNVEMMLQSVGVTLLKNAGQVIAGRRGGHRFYLAGVDDYKHGVVNVHTAMAALPEAEALPVIMLAHNPLFFDTLAQTPGVPVHLQLSGHTHAGHFYLPFLGPVYRHVFKMRYRSGFYQRGHTTLYVTSGLAGAAFYLNTPVLKTGFPRFRFNSYPEIAVFDLLPAPLSEAASSVSPGRGAVPLNSK